MRTSITLHHNMVWQMKIILSGTIKVTNMTKKYINAAK